MSNQLPPVATGGQKVPEAPPSPSTPTPTNPSNGLHSAFVVQDGNSNHLNENGGSKSSPQAAATSATSPTTGLLRPPTSAGGKKPSHNRGVSWGVATTSPIPPPLPVPVVGNRGPLPSWDGSTLSGTKKDTLDINDVINADGHKELEAETYILQAVEKMTGHHQRTNTDISSLYGSIVDDEMTRSSGQHDDETDDEEEDDDQFDDEHHAPVISQSQRSSTRPVPTKQPSVSTVASSKSTARFKWLVKKQMMKSKTVEGTLFGLTAALKELDQAPVHMSTTISHSQDEAHVYETTLTAGDKLAQAVMGNADEDIEATGGGGIGTIPEGKEDDEKDNSHSGGGDDDGKRSSKRKSSNNRVVKGASEGVKEEWELFNTFFATRKERIKAYTRRIMLMILLPSLGIAFFLFYVVENPELCAVKNYKVNGTVAPTMSPSFSPSFSPTMAPTDPMVDDSPFFIFWAGSSNETTAVPFFMTNATTNATVNVTIPPNVTEPPDPGFLDLEKFLVCPGLGASASWWFLFMGVRQIITFTMALITQAIMIDYMALSSRIFLNILGPIVTLLIVQSKGWPFILTFWAIYDLVLLCGDEPYHHHWGYFQDYLDIFNDGNPSGEVVNNPWNQRILVNAIIIGVAVAVKRLVVGLFLGRQQFSHYGQELASIMKRMVLVGEVATLARQIESVQEEYEDNFSVGVSMNSTGWNTKNIQAFVAQEADETDAAEEEPVVACAADAAKAFAASREGGKKANVANGEAESKPTNADTGTVRSIESAIASDPEFTESQQVEMAELLDEWEEPQTAEEAEEKNITIGAVLQFRQALTFMKKTYPFLPAFGPADTREACIESSQRVYDRLLLRTPYQADLPFETLALLAKSDDGSIDKEKAKELIQVFRPERDGSLGKLEFVKSVDIVYKNLRLLSANISNSSQMDAAVETLVNVIFYIVLGAIIIYRLGEDPLSLFLSFSSILLAFAFMFGKSSAKYMEGCLFILVQRPYGVGDRIHLSLPQLETSANGSSGWIVERISLFTTSVYWGVTNERATLCNGAVANLRVINAARSPNATVYVDLKFSIDTEYERIEIFRTAVEQYLKDRPREWLAFIGFRPSEVAVDKGFIAYKVIAQHRNSWQAIGGITESKANLTTYCLEVAKQLGMRYLSPSLPVNLTVKDAEALALPTLGDEPVGADASEYPQASPKDAKEALSAIQTGIRQRKGQSRFADLVRMAMEANKDK